MRELRFNDFRIDLNGLTLYHRDRPIPIGRKTLDALLYLIENRDRVVSKEALRRQLWRSAKLGHSTIPMCIKEIRTALSDNARNPKYLEAKRGKGYRFLPEVELICDDASQRIPAGEPPFVGRRKELDSIQNIIRRTAATLRGEFTCIVGEAGVGKSRLITEVIHQFSHQATVIFSKASSTNLEFGYSIWSQSLEQISPDKKKLVRSLRALRTAEGLAGHPDDSFEKSKKTNRVTRHAFFEEWKTLFRSLSRHKPTLLILEDIHYADRDSLLLLEQIASLASTIPLIVLATTRPLLISQAQTTRTFANFLSSTSSLIPINPFNINEIESLLDPYSQGRSQFATDLLHLTSGNPFYVTHLIRLWSETSGREHHTPPAINIENNSAQEVVARQLNDLPSSTREALVVASAIGNQFRLSILADVLRASRGDVAQRLEPARSARIISELDRCYEFRHAILRDYLYQSTPRDSRVLFHARISESLERRMPRASALEIFEHQHRGHPIVPAEALCRTAIEAGRRLTDSFSFLEATRILGIARQIAEEELEREPQLRFEILVALGNAALYSGDRQLCKTVLSEAAQLARESGSAKDLASAGLAMAPDFLSIEVGTYDVSIVMVLKEALSQLPDEDLATKARALSRLSQLARWGGEPPEVSEKLATDALLAARASQDPSALTSALSSYADATHGPDRTDDRVAVIDELRELTLARGDTYSYLLQQTRLIAALLERGDVRQVAIENESYRRAAEKTGLPQYRWYPVSTDSMLACLAGDLELAGELAEQYRQIAGENSDQNFKQTFACQYALRQIEADATESIVDLIEGFCRNQPSVLSWSAALAWALWDCGREDAARECLRQFSESDLIRLFREPGGTIGIAAISEVTAYIGARDRAQKLLEILDPVATRCAIAGLGVAYFGSLSRYAGLLALSLGHREHAEKLIKSAMFAESERGALSWEIYSRLDYFRAQQGSLSVNPKRIPSRIRHLLQRKGALLPRAKRRVSDTLLLHPNSRSEPSPFSGG